MERISRALLLTGFLIALSLNSEGQALTADFTANVTTICNGGSVVFTDASTGTSGTTTYSWDFGTGATPSTASTAGPHTVTYSATGAVTVTLLITDNSESDTEIKTDFITVVADPAITVNPVSPSAVCIGATMSALTVTATGGTPGLTYQWYSNTVNNNTTGTAIGGATTASYTPSSATAGTLYYYCIASASGTGCASASSGTAVVTVVADPAITVNPVSPSAVCVGASLPALTITATGGTPTLLYQWYSNTVNNNTTGTAITGANAASYTPSSAVAGTLYYYCIASCTGSGCGIATSAAAGVTVNPLPTASISGTASVCRYAASPIVTFTGANGTQPYIFTYRVNGGATQTISTTIGNSVTLTVPTTTATTYVYSLVSIQDGSTTSCSQSQTGSATVTVNPLPVATASNNSPICASTALNLTGGPASMSIYAWTGPNSFTSSLQSPVVSSGATTSMSGTYTLVVTNSNGCKDTVTTTATVNPLPTATINGTVVVCRNEAQPTITFTGSGGTTPYTFTYNINGGTNLTVSTSSGSNIATIQASTSSVGTFNFNLVSVRDGSSTNCSQTQSGTATVTVNPLPTATISGSTSVCRNSPSPSITFTGAGGTTPYTFTYTINSGTNYTVSSASGSSTATVTVPTGIAGTFTYSLVSVSDGSSTSCSQAQSGTVTVLVNPLPSASITGSTTVCRNATSPGVTFTGSGGTTPYTFTYNINGGTNTTVTTPSGSSSAIVSVPTTTPGTFMYNLVSVTDGSTTACSQTQSGTATVIVNPLPSATISGTTAVCRNATFPSVTFTGSGGTTPYTFTYNINGGTSTTISTIAGSSSIDIPISTATAGTFVYNLLSVSDGSTTSCSQTQSGSATITVNPLPTATINGSTAVCQNGSQPYITFTGAGGTTPYTFTYNINGNTNLTTTTASGSSTVTVAAPTTVSGTFIYNLVSVTDGSSTSCSQTQSGSATVTVNPLPSAIISGTTAVCRNAPQPLITFTGSGGTTPYTFTYSVNSGASQTVTSSAGSSIASVPVSTTSAGTFTYSLLSVRDGSATTCSQTQSGTATVTINPLPAASISGATSVCRNAASPLITFLGSGGTTPYTFTYNINNGETLTAVTTSENNSVSVAAPTSIAGTFNYNLVSVRDGSSTTCSQAQTGTATITVNPLPTATISGTTAVCQNASRPNITFTGSGGTIPYTFTYTINSGENQIVTATTGSVVTVSVPTNVVGSFTYSLVSVSDASSTACSQSQTGSVTVTINPLPTATISGTTAVCQSAGAPLVTFTGAGGTTPYTFTYNINGGTNTTVSTVSGSSTVTVAAPTTTAGSFEYNLVSVQDGSTTACSQAQSGKAIITVNPLPSATISGTTNVCRNSSQPEITFTGSGGTIPYTFTYNINGGSTQTVAALTSNSTTVTVPTSTVGTYTYNLLSVRDGSSTACSRTQTGSAIVTVNALPVTSSITGYQTPACSATGQVYSVTLTSGSSYSWSVPEGATITAGATGPNNNSITVNFGIFNGNVSVIETNSSGCAGSRIDLPISLMGCELNADFSASSTSLCNGSSVVFTSLTTGTTGTTTYSWDFGAGATPATTTGMGPHTVTYSTTGYKTISLVATDGASNTETKNNYLIVNPLPTATISGTTAVCQNGIQPYVTFTGSGATTPYTFTYNINGGGNLTVATTSGSSSVNVPAQTSASGTFTYNLVSVRDGSSTACSQDVSGTAVITVNPLPTATISGTTAVCLNDASPLVTFTGSGGTTPYTFTYNINGGTNSTVTSPSGSSTVSIEALTSTAGTYYFNLVSVRDASSTTCMQNQGGVAVITVNPLPTATVTGTTTVCRNATQPYITFTGSGGTAPYTFTYNINNGTNQTITTSVGSVISIPVSTSSADSFNYNLVGVMDGTSTHCSRSLSGMATVTVNPLPSATIIGTTAVCQGGTQPDITFTGSGGTTPYTFTYNINGGANLTVSSSSGESTAVVSATTSTAGSFVYNLVSVTDGSSTSCSQAQTGSVTITVNPLPSAIITGNTVVCRNDATPSVTFTGSGGTRPYTFTYTINSSGSYTVSTTAGNNSASVSVPTGEAGTFTYSLVSVRDGSSTTCLRDQSGTATVTVNPLPTATISGSTSVCQNATQPNIIFTGAGGTTPYTFTYTINGVNTQTVTTATGSSSVTVGVPTSASGTYLYTLMSVRDGSSTMCSQTQIGTALVTVNPLPAASITGTTAVCQNASQPGITFTGSGGSSPYTFTYNINGNENLIATTASGNSVTVYAPTTNPGTYVYNLVSVRDGSATLCTQAQNGSATITVNPLPTASISGTATVCRSAASPIVTFTGAGGTAPYTFTYNINGAANQTVTTSVGNSATVLASTSTSGTFTYNLISVRDGTSTQCSRAQSGSVVITINPLPAGTISGTTAVCLNAPSPNITFTGSGGTTPYIFTYTINSGAEHTVSSTTGNSIATVAVPTTASGSYTYSLISVTDGSSTACSQTQSGNVTVTVNPLPTAIISGTTAVCRTAPSPSVTFTGAGGTTPYTFTYNINGVGSYTVSSVSGSNVASVTAPTTTAGSYAYNLISVRDGSSTTCSQAQTGTAIVTVNPLPTATISGSTTVCRNAPQPNVTFTGAGGTAPYTFTYRINTGSNQTVTTSGGNSITVPAPTNVTGTFVYTLISVSDASTTFCSQAQTGTATITVNPLPSAVISGTTSVCKDDPNPLVTFTGSGSTAPYTFTYNINNGTSLSVTSTGNTATVSVPTTTSGTFTYNLLSVRDASSTLCSQSQTGSAVVTVSTLPLANAGSGGNECDRTFVFNATPSFGIGTWSRVSGPGTASFSPNANSPTATVTVSLYGTYTFAWTEINGTCSNSNNVIVNFYQQPVANAGTGGSECDLNFSLSATASVGAGSWTRTGGTGTATFGNANSPSTTVTVSAYGTYVFNWTETNGTCSDASSVVVDFNENPTLITNAAGADQNVCGMSTEMTCTPHTYLAVPNDHSGSTRAWSQISGPGTSVFSVPDSPVSSVTVTAYGSYTFRWTETNGTCSRYDEVIIDFNEDPVLITNAAGGDQNVCGASSTLSATAHVYAIAPNDHSGSTRIWTRVSGPGTATFTASTSPSTTVSVSVYGIYVFRWTETNGPCSHYDEVTVDFNESPNTLDAGGDKFVCGSVVSMTGTAYSYRASPNDHSGSTRYWTQVSGPGTATFTTTGSPTSSVSVDVYGVYVFRWTETNGACSSYDDVIVDYNEDPVTISAGSNRNVCGLVTQMTGTAYVYLDAPNDHSGSTRLWSQVSGPGTATFTNPASPVSDVSVTAYGSYIFMWTEVNSTCDNFATVSITFIDAPVANAGSGGHECDMDFTLNAVPTSGVGTWTMTSGPGNAVFTPDQNQPDAVVTVDDAGTYLFTWTEVNSTCSSHGVVEVVFHDLPEIFAGYDTIVCENTSFSLHATGEGLFAWSPDSLLNDPDVADPVASPVSSETFKVVLTDQFGCVNSDSVYVEVWSNPVADAGPDQILDYIFNTSLEANLEINETGIWSVVSGSGTFAGSTDPLSGVADLTLLDNELMWTVTNGVCPPASDRVMIHVKPLLIPTLITPDGNGINDYFELKGIVTLGRTELTVFDRRGLQVYKSDNYANDWNGVDRNGRDLPEDTYFIVLKSQNGLSVSNYLVIRR